MDVIILGHKKMIRITIEDVRKNRKQQKCSEQNRTEQNNSEHSCRYLASNSHEYDNATSLANAQTAMGREKTGKFCSLVTNNDLLFR
jgi:hypothetical protein